jgi:hypothetical protein
MDSDNYYSSDEEVENVILIKDIPKEVLRIYEKADSEEKLKSVSNHLIDLMNTYNLSIKTIDFEDEIYNMYEDVIKEYIYWQAPEKILDANSYNLPQKFLEWAYNNTDKGIELSYLNDIYIELIHLTN